MTQPHDDSPSMFFRRRPGYAPTPLVELPVLAQQAGVARVYLKDESRRPLGSFKSLGGMYAGLRALVRATGSPGIETLVAARARGRSLPALLCASDGNHGLAVAAGAELAGAPARVYLHRHVPPARAGRIADRRAEIVWVEGTYDDAVDEAYRAAQRGDGILIADTSANEDDPVVADVLAGYELSACEIVEQLQISGMPPPTHLCVQAGVGGLAAAMARGLARFGTFLLRTIVVEPVNVACVGRALRLGHMERLRGDLRTAADMLSCGEASAPAVTILRQLNAAALTVDEAALLEAPARLADGSGPATTPSGAAGLAGLLSIQPGSPTARQYGIDDTSRILLIATEGSLPVDSHLVR